jgi:hypothetical protein
MPEEAPTYNDSQQTDGLDNHSAEMQSHIPQTSKIMSATILAAQSEAGSL